MLFDLNIMYHLFKIQTSFYSEVINICLMIIILYSQCSTDQTEETVLHPTLSPPRLFRCFFSVSRKNIQASAIHVRNPRSPLGCLFQGTFDRIIVPSHGFFPDHRWDFRQMASILWYICQRYVSQLFPLQLTNNTVIGCFFMQKCFTVENGSSRS